MQDILGEACWSNRIKHDILLLLLLVNSSHMMLFCHIYHLYIYNSIPILLLLVYSSHMMLFCHIYHVYIYNSIPIHNNMVTHVWHILLHVVDHVIINDISFVIQRGNFHKTTLGTWDWSPASLTTKSSSKPTNVVTSSIGRLRMAMTYMIAKINEFSSCTGMLYSVFQWVIRLHNQKLFRPWGLYVFSLWSRLICFFYV